MEEFFKPISTENKVIVFRACQERGSASFQELRNDLKDIISEPTLAKQLSELVASDFLEKLVYNRGIGYHSVYRITQKSIDVLPVFEEMREFCRQYLQMEGEDIMDCLFCVKKMLGSRWNARIVWLLYVLRSVRFNELKNSIEGISFKMLTQQLRYLEDEGAITRKDFHENPPHIEYSLTPKGEALYGILLMVAKWNTRYGDNKSAVGTWNHMV